MFVQYTHELTTVTHFRQRSPAFRSFREHSVGLPGPVETLNDITLLKLRTLAFQHKANPTASQRFSDFPRGQIIHARVFIQPASHVRVHRQKQSFRKHAVILAASRFDGFYSEITLGWWTVGAWAAAKKNALFVRHLGLGLDWGRDSQVIEDFWVIAPVWELGVAAHKMWASVFFLVVTLIVTFCSVLLTGLGP